MSENSSRLTLFKVKSVYSSMKAMQISKEEDLDWDEFNVLWNGDRNVARA